MKTVIAREDIGSPVILICEGSALGKVRHRIVTRHIHPPIPDRQFDWTASEDNYDQGACLGYGPTEEAAIADLLEQLED